MVDDCGGTVMMITKFTGVQPIEFRPCLGDDRKVSQTVIITCRDENDVKSEHEIALESYPHDGSPQIIVSQTTEMTS
jgi:hypothetical protein